MGMTSTETTQTFQPTTDELVARVYALIDETIMSGTTFAFQALLGQMIASLEGRYGKGDYTAQWRRVGIEDVDFATEQAVVHALAWRLVSIERGWDD
jgi:hypothetical protein